MANRNNRELAREPEDLARFFVQRANAGDVEGLVALYEDDAILAIGPDGQVAIGHEAIRTFYAKMLAAEPQFEPDEQRPSLRHGDLALTSSRLVDGTVRGFHLLQDTFCPQSITSYVNRVDIGGGQSR